MAAPKLNYKEVRKALELAEEFLAPYQKELDENKTQLEISRKELSSANALISLSKRSAQRTTTLNDCGEFSSFYCKSLANINIEECKKFSSTLEYRISRFAQKVETCEIAIKLLNSDIADLQQILNMPFQGDIAYLTYINDGPGMSFFGYTPKAWLERWLDKEQATNNNLKP